MAKTILIVEDEQNIVDILSFNLRREGYETMEAYDGPTGLELALTKNPDLILLDLMLPGMNGFQVCKQIRASGSSIPILMLTAREEESDKVLGLELGGDDYITKPFSMREPLSFVRPSSRPSSQPSWSASVSGFRLRSPPAMIRSFPRPAQPPISVFSYKPSYSLNYVYTRKRPSVTRLPR